LPTFAHSKWEQYNIKDVVTVEGWQKNPELVLRFYNERREQLARVEPNTAHRILAGLEKDFDVTVITQNVDNLHERAGSTKVIHLHGQLTKARSSLHPEMIFDIGYRPIQWGEQAPDGSQLRPHVVLFGEPVSMFEAAKSTVATADIFLVIGSALTVYPAKELIKSVQGKASVFLINPNEVKYPGRDVTIVREKATTGMEKLKKILTATPTPPQTNGKTNIYNVVILDQSGSMASIKLEAINGYNETLQTIKAAQQKYADSQEHFVTLVVFNSSATDTVYDRVVCSDATELTSETYQPNSRTPLYDAMGTTLTKFRQTLDATADNKVLVTIITDGMENDSKEYTGKQIYQMVNELKAMGWVFTYIGADHNVEEASKNMGITNTLRFEKSRQGTDEMFLKERISRGRYYARVAEKCTFTDGDYFEEDIKEKQ